MIEFYLANLRNQVKHTTREVMEDPNKQSDNRLIKVNHPKGWDAKPLV